MLALPAAPAQPARRQTIVGTVVVCVVAGMLLVGMLALWVMMRRYALNTERRWVPEGVSVPEVPTNVMLAAFLPACLFAQWAVYAARRGDRTNTGLALGLTGLMGVAIVNAQAFAWSQMGVAAKGPTAFNAMFYAVTGVMTLLVIAGIVYTVVAAFRYLGGRTAERDLLAGHAVYWYFLAAAFAVVWLVVYVTK